MKKIQLAKNAKEFDRRFDNGEDIHDLIDITPTLQKPEVFRVKASKGEVVVFYFEPLVTKDLKFSGFPKG